MFSFCDGLGPPVEDVEVEAGEVEVVDVGVEVCGQAGTLTCEFFIIVCFLNFFTMHPDFCPDPNFLGVCLTLDLFYYYYLILYF